MDAEIIPDDTIIIWSPFDGCREIDKVKGKILSYLGSGDYSVKVGDYDNRMNGWTNIVKFNYSRIVRYGEPVPKV